MFYESVTGVGLDAVLSSQIPDKQSETEATKKAKW